MIMEYKVSVIVPVYKAEKYLKCCVDSLLAQTMCELEIILVDDGSPDECGTICDQYAGECPNVQVLHIENSGPSRARNIGIGKAHGKYIGFVDADDYVSPDMFAELLSEANGSKADIVMCRYYIDNDGIIKEYPMEYHEEYIGHESIVNGLSALYSKPCHNGLYSVCNKLFKSTLLQENGLQFDERLIRAEDAWFVFECLKIAERVSFVDKPLYYYRQIGSSTMHRKISSDRYQCSKRFREKLMIENDALGIKPNLNEFYYEFLYEVFLFCRYKVQMKEYDKVNEVLKDPFLEKASNYCSLVPTHLKLLCCFERRHLYWIVIVLLKAWK